MDTDLFSAMVTANGSATSDWIAASASAPLRLLVVGANQRWTRVVAAAAARLNAVAVDTAGNSRAALARVLTASPPYSLVLLQARRADTEIDALADLTAGDAGSGTGLLLLGDAGRALPGSIVVEQANRAALNRALDQHSRDADGTPPPTLTRAEMVAALNGPALRLRYQPVIRLSDQQPTGLEVLARLDHAALGMLSAEHFIPQMEAAGLSRLLTRIMITRAMQEACAHGLTRLGLRIGLNVPLNVLLMPETFELLETQRQQCAIPASQIVIELTETQPVRDLDTLRGVVRRLNEFGYRVSIDDATPEMTNTAALLEMEFASVKFDKSVVQQASYDPDSRSFIERTVKIAREAGIQTIAEGIEDTEHLELMHALGVDSAQGFRIARPLPAGAVKLWLEARQQSALPRG